MDFSNFTGLCEEIGRGRRKIKKFEFLSSNAGAAQGNLITHPYVGVAGADGSIALARRARAGAKFEILGFQ